jgi:hypothetical protein
MRERNMGMADRGGLFRKNLPKLLRSKLLSLSVKNAVLLFRRMGCV